MIRPYTSVPWNWNQVSTKCSNLRTTPDVWRRSLSARPKTSAESLAEAQLTPEGGIDGDRWVRDSYYRLHDGRSDPRCQVSLMNARFLRQIAGGNDAMCLAGDNLIVDLDLSEDNLPAGSQLTIGPDVVVEITTSPTRAVRNSPTATGTTPAGSPITSAAKRPISAAATRKSFAAAPSKSATMCASERPRNAAINSRQRSL